jgi:hypothetical protein
VRDDIFELNEALPVCDPRVEVAITVERFEAVPYAKPDCVASAPPVDVIEPLSVAVVAAIEDAADVVIVGAIALPDCWTSKVWVE